MVAWPLTCVGNNAAAQGRGWHAVWSTGLACTFWDLHSMALKSGQLLMGALALSCGLWMVDPARAQAPGAPDEWLLPIAPGDTLISLAARWVAEPHDWRDLQRYNVLANPRRLVPGTALRVPSAWLRRQSTQAQVVFVQGDASYRSGKLGPWLPLVAGATLGGQDALRTGPGASVVTSRPSPARAWTSTRR